MTEPREDYRAAIAWFLRVCSGQVGLCDLQIGTVKQHFRAVLRWKGINGDGELVHRGLCPHCGSAIELRKDIEE